MPTRNERLLLTMDTGFLLARASALVIQTSNARLAPFGLRVRQYSVLAVACDAAGVTQRELARIVGLDPSQIVAIVDELEENGLVERRANRRDRRTRLIAATAQGREVREQAAAAIDVALESFLAPLDENERAVLPDILRRALLADLGETADSEESSDA